MKPSEIADNRTDLLTFSKTMFRERKGIDLLDNWHQEAICEALEKVVVGLSNRLIINIPPRSGKTEIAVINFIAWCMGNFPDSEFIHASYSKRLATSNAYNVRAIMQNEKYCEIFPYTDIKADSSAKDEFRTAQSGIVYATGADGTITGYGAGKMRDSFGGAIVIDDPHKAGEANSDTMRGNVLDWFSTTMESRKNRPDTPIIIIMQRLHEEDLTGFLLSGCNGETWDHINISSETDKGESFWPHQFPWEELKRKEKANSYVYAGQYLQRPAPVGGGIFKDDWWQYYTIKPTFEWRAIYADTAQKTKEHNDYSVFQCWGRTSDNKAYLIDMIRGKWEAPELLQQARMFWNKHKSSSDTGTLRAMKIEDKSSGTGLIQTLGREGVPIKAIQRSIDKVTRAMDVAPSIEGGLVYINTEVNCISDYIREHNQFPNSKNDDTVDPSMDAISDMLVNGRRIEPISFSFIN